MPALVKELLQGQGFSRTSEENNLNDTFTRVFRVVLSSPAEVFNPQVACGVLVGSIHPFNPNLICHSVDVKNDGDSRMVVIVTFSYKSYASSAASNNKEDPRSQPPEVRSAEWSTDTSLVEAPAETWKEMLLVQNGEAAVPAANAKFAPPVNPVGDRYEGVTKMVPVTVIRIEQFEPTDPLKWTDYIGHINSKKMKVGDHQFPVHTVMFRGVSYRPHVETFGERTVRGWMASYEFHFKLNQVEVSDPDGGNATSTVKAGWDRLQILEGPRVKNIAGSQDDQNVDPWALALEHADGKVVVPFKIVPAAEGNPSEAMVAVPAFDPATGGTNGMRQVRASSPVALNENGTPRWVAGGTLKPIIKRYQTQPDVDFITLFGLRV